MLANMITSTQGAQRMLTQSPAGRVPACAPRAIGIHYKKKGFSIPSRTTIKSRATGEFEPPQAPPPPPQKPQTLIQQMGFAGWAPEVINGRLAMLGIFAGLGAELATGESIPAQFGAHFSSFLWAFIIITAASFIPGLSSSDANPAKLTKRDGIWTPSAEMLNGRVAMLALAATIAIEAVAGQALWG